MKPRDYQQQCIDAIHNELNHRSSTLAVLATGLGKTVIFSAIASEWPSRVLVIAHRDELIRQAAEKLYLTTGEHPGIEMGDEQIDEQGVFRPRVVVSSIQTMSRPNRQRKFRPSDFGLAIIDEAHHAVARSYRSTLSYFQQNPDLKTLGVTATANRADQLALGQIFDSVAFEYGIEPGISDGWLVKIFQQAVVITGLDFSAARSLAGDFNEADLEKILSEEKILHAVAAPLIEIAGDRPGLVFCVSVAHATLMAEVLCRYRKDSAIAISGQTPMEDRRKNIEAYKAGKIQFLCNCGIFLEGFDAPNTAIVAMARPTKSLALYTQILGRGTRPLPGVVDGLGDPFSRRQAIASSAKPSMLVIDYVGNSGKHKIITAADLLGGKYAEPVKQYARKTLQEEGVAAGVDESLERAKDELALLEEIKARQRREQIKARAEYVAREVSPFGTSPNGPAFSSRSSVVPVELATPNQVWHLVNRLGYSRERAEGMSKRQAGHFIGNQIRAKS